MKEKSVARLVFLMSVPNVLSMFVNSMYNIVDSFFVARISENAMTALSLVFPVQNLVTSVGVGFGVGINALIALSMGAENQKQADSAASYGLLFSILHGILLAVFCVLGMPAFLRLFTSDSEVILLGVRYSRVAFPFAVAVTTGIGLEKIFQAVGRMKTTMIVLSAGCITNIILDPILIFGAGPIPALGMEGAALATGIGQTVSLVLYILVCIRSPLPVKIAPSMLKSGNPLRRLYSVGIPAALNMALPSVLISALNGILAVYSQVYVVILGIYYKLQTFVSLPANGVIQGIRPLISFNYGAEEYGRVRKIYQTALLFCLAIMLVGMALCMGMPGTLMSLFTQNAETITEGVTALRVISLGFLISSVSITTCGSLEALGEGGASLLISVLRYIVCMIPLAFLMSRWIGPRGVWHAFWLTEALACVVACVLYRKFLTNSRNYCSLG